MLEITSISRGQALVAEVTGELDLGTAGLFRSRIDADLERFKARDLILDFSNVSFIDSSGLGAMLGRYRRLAERGGRVALAGCRPHIGRLLELSGVGRIVESFPTTDQAVLALEAAAHPRAGGGGR